MDNHHSASIGKVDLPQPVPWRVIVVFIAVDVALLVLINQVLFAGHVFDALGHLTGGLVNATLQASLLRLLVGVGIVLFWFGRLKTRDVGLLWPQLSRAALVTLAVWLLTQLLLAACAALTNSWAVDLRWTRLGWTGVLGLLIGQLCGNALVEEIEYRGFLLPQIFLNLRGGSHRRRLVLALAVALVVFTLTHIPNQLMQSVTPADLGLDLLFILGWTLMLNVIYLVTGNLFIAVGVHALIDAPTALIPAPFPAQVAVAIAAVLVLAGERRLRAWQLRPPANILPRPMSSH